jgi:CubicO group peptidase (beta-lactamase class C family)
MNQDLQNLLEQHITQDGFTGGAVIAAKHGQIILEQYAGIASPDQAVSANTLWCIASISKVYAVATIMRLVELGAITLNTLASAVIPEFTGQGREDIRLRHLVTHTSGLIYEAPNMESLLEQQVPFSTILEIAYTAPLQFKPGTSLAYADYNTLIAGQMLENIMGEPLPALVKKYILEPMGLHNTYFPTPIEQDHRLAQVRNVMADNTNGAMYNSRYARSLPHPAFAVTTTAQDMMRFLLHFAPTGPRVLSNTTIAAMTRNQTGVVTGIHPSVKGYDTTAPMPWGIGWALQTEHLPALQCELASFKTFGHGGASGCQVFIDPETDISVAVLTNSHLRAGREPWYRRLQSIMNLTYNLASRTPQP